MYFNTIENTFSWSLRRLVKVVAAKTNRTTLEGEFFLLKLESSSFIS